MKVHGIVAQAQKVHGNTHLTHESQKVRGVIRLVREGASGKITKRNAWRIDFKAKEKYDTNHFRIRLQVHNIHGSPQKDPNQFRKIRITSERSESPKKDPNQLRKIRIA